ncbi:GvpL/GvpF family gas vesicle protein [Streptomyces sp. NPDC053367]|uniref:GvpL/GvpF family gas vesicle protein n=1 Tax=Streptomyces sp. NPDC053367 TaxID=3365700 RepID=UPI0037D0E206
MSVYVYAITKASHPLRLDDVTGVGDPPAEVRVVPGDSLCAVVSESPADLSVSRQDLQAHHEVGQRLWADGPVLPLSFGFTAEDDDAVRAVLEERGPQMAQRLDELTGRGEFNVKGVAQEDALVGAELQDNRQARELNERTRKGAGTYEDRVALGQLLAEGVQRREQALAEEILAVLRPLALAEQTSPPSGQYFVNSSFLVDEERYDEFARTGQELSERYGEAAEVRLRGPLAPYSFV